VLGVKCLVVLSMLGVLVFLFEGFRLLGYGGDSGALVGNGGIGGGGSGGVGR
jgi:hypothetical protein